MLFRSYYLKLAYADGKLGGFLSDAEGNLIDRSGEILTSVEDMEEVMQDGLADELLDWEGDLMKGILIKSIVEEEEVVAPREELDEEVSAAQLTSGGFGFFD